MASTMVLTEPAHASGGRTETSSKLLVRSTCYAPTAERMFIVRKRQRNRVRDGGLDVIPAEQRELLRSIGLEHVVLYAGRRNLPSASTTSLSAPGVKVASYWRGV
jgi:hypothetical protein